MTQLLLWQDEANAPPALTCAFGERWMGPHPRCDAHGAELARAFAAAVACGEFDAQGYTLADRRRQSNRVRLA